MTKKILLLCAGICLVFSAWAQNKKAADYNNKIIDIQYKLVPDVVAFFKAMDSGNAADLKAKKDKLMKDFDKAIASVGKMKPFEGDIKLRNAALDWFKLYESTLDDEYNMIIDIVSKPKDKRTDEDKAKLKKLSDELIAQEEKIDQSFHLAQTEFSKKHNLELKEYAIGETTK